MSSRPVLVLFLMVLPLFACEMIAGIGERKVDTAEGSGGMAGIGGAGGGSAGTSPGSGGARAPGLDGGSADGGNPGSGDGAAAGGNGGGIDVGATAAGGTTAAGGATGGGDGGSSGTGGVTSTAGVTGSGGMLGSGGVKLDAAPDAPMFGDAANDAPACPPTVSQGSGNGLQGEYFVTSTLTGLQVTRIDPAIDFDWPGSPDLGVPADGFSVRWTGQVQPRYSDRYTFYTNSDDGIRLWVNGNLIVDDWNAHAATESSGVADLSAGQKYDIKVEYFEEAGVANAQLSWASNCQTREIIPRSQLYAPSATCAAASVGTGMGLKGDYYNNQDLTALARTRTDPVVSFVWADGDSPDPAIEPLTYSVRWTGQVQAKYSGPTTFYITADDGVRLTIDEALVIDDWNSHAVTENAATLNLVAGQRYDLRLEFFEEAGGAEVHLSWVGACQSREIIPQAQLYPPIVVAVDAGTGGDVSTAVDVATIDTGSSVDGAVDLP